MTIMVGGMNGEVEFLFYIMFWTILAMMLVLLYSLKQVIMTQSYIKNIDVNIEKLVMEVLRDEEKILEKENKIINSTGKSKKKILKNLLKK
jgi:hypothetical protein